MNQYKPFIPIARPCVGRAELAAIEGVFDSKWLGLGSVTADFESRLSEMFSGRSVCATNTGTSAIELALRTIGIRPGDDVITPAMTFVATAQAIAATGARPVLCDIDPTTLNVSIDTLEQARTPNTRAVVPVDYRGVPVDIDAICAWAKIHGIRVVQDAAHSFGSFLADGSPVGSRGDIACFSFDPIKNITCGEGGAIVFGDEEEYARANRLRVLGINSTAWSRLEAKRPWEYDVTELGFRYHMPNFAAAIGLSQLDRLTEFRETKQRVLHAYQDALHDHRWLTMPAVPIDRCLPFLAVLLTDHRDQLMAHLREHQIGSGVQYQSLDSFSLFKNDNGGDLSVTHTIAKTLLTVPILNDQTIDEQERVITALLAFAPNV